MTAAVLLQVAAESHNAAVGALKQGWAAELKRQAANWEAAAAAKQEAWRAAKVAEIKEQTVKVRMHSPVVGSLDQRPKTQAPAVQRASVLCVLLACQCWLPFSGRACVIATVCCVDACLQGLEVEVQRLINRHRSDLEAAHDKAAEQVQEAVEAAKAEHGIQQQTLKEKLRQVRGLSCLQQVALAVPQHTSCSRKMLSKLVCHQQQKGPIPSVRQTDPEASRRGSFNSLCPGITASLTPNTNG